MTMPDIQKQKIKVEIIWWLATIVLVIIVLLPIWQKAPSFPFFAENIFFIVAFVTFARYALLFRTTLIAYKKWIKVAVILVAGILFFVMTTGMSDFRNFVDVQGLQTLVTDLHVNEQTRIINYIKNEMVFFGVGAIIGGILLPLRMILSFWRMRNHGTV